MDEISFPFANFKGQATEVWEWISNFISFEFARDYLSMQKLK